MNDRVCVCVEEGWRRSMAGQLVCVSICPPCWRVFIYVSLAGSSCVDLDGDGLL